MLKNLIKIEEKTFTEEDFIELPPSDIVAYNELRSCADLFRMYKGKVLNIRPEFQRDIVWLPAAQTRFIDSLIKQLPIPSMCFSLDYKTQQWQVIDGLQRISTIIRFLSDRDWVLSVLPDVDSKISGRPVSEIMDETSELHKLYLTVENLTLPITVIRCDYSKKSHTNYLFTIFHRLNTGGTKLNNQEIRNCIFSGRLNDLLKDLNKDQSWRKINRMKADKSYRFTKEELILRFFAFYDNLDKYNGRLAKFLNDFMSDNRNPNDQELQRYTGLFHATVNVLFTKIFDLKTAPRLGTTLLEALMFGVGTNLDFISEQNSVTVKALYSNLKNHDSLSEENLREGLAGKEKVTSRLNAARQIFSGNV